MKLLLTTIITLLSCSGFAQKVVQRNTFSNEDSMFSPRCPGYLPELLRRFPDLLSGTEPTKIIGKIQYQKHLPTIAPDTTKPEPFRGGYIGSKVIITKRDYYDTTPNRNLLQKLERILVWKEIVDQECKKKDTAYNKNDVTYTIDGLPVDSLELEQLLSIKKVKNISPLPSSKTSVWCARHEWFCIITTYSDKELKKLARIEKRNKRRGN